MAIGFIDSKAHPAAAPFYGKFPQEPTTSGSFINVDKAHEISGITFELLLDNILTKAAPGGDVLIVSHGTANGLSLKLTSGATYKIGDIGATESLLTDTTKVAAERLKLSEAKVTQLQDKIAKVQALKINHLALRACKVGSWESTMGLIKRLFGAASVSAPQKRDAYFFLDPAKRGYAIESQWTSWTRDHPINPIESTTPTRFCIRATENDDGTHTFTTDNLAESADAVTQWVQRHWYGAETFAYTKGSTLALHAMWNDPLIYPKDADYLTNMRFFIKPESLFGD